jgi:cytochrome oxidase Cu insertion factor (SCO1/SenC/PrrC family)
MTPPPERAKGRRTLLLLALVALSPVVASYAAYYWFTPSKRLNYGELIGPTPVPAITGLAEDGAAFDLASLRGKWLLLIASRSACDAACDTALHATKQARTIQGRERDRVARVLLLPSGVRSEGADRTPDGEEVAAAQVQPATLTSLPLNPTGTITILILDPRGNIVLRYPANPDVKGLSKDLERLLRASQMG